MNLKDFFQSKEFKEQTQGAGLPEGDSFFNLEQIDVKITPFIDEKGQSRPRFFITKNGEVEGNYVPLSVIKSFEKLAAKGVKAVRVSRAGLTKSDTRYIVIEAK